MSSFLKKRRGAGPARTAAIGAGLPQARTNHSSALGEWASRSFGTVQPLLTAIMTYLRAIDNLPTDRHFCGQ